MSKDDRQMVWLRDVLEWQKDMTNPSEFIEYLKMDLYTEDIFVFTPAGRLIHLVKGATPLDFAFAVHTEVGIHCSGAKINGRLQPLSTQIRSGDEVEIITNPNRTPSHDWLKLVRTPQARTKIKRWLKQKGHEQSVALGKEIIERRLKEFHAKLPPEDQLLELAKKMGKTAVDDLFAAIGNGSLSSSNLVHEIIPTQEKKEEPGFVGKVIERIRGAKGIRVQGLDNMMFRFAGCCQPVPGEPIVGFITRGRGVTIHQADCQTAANISSQFPERQITVSWDTAKDQNFVVQLEMLVEDRREMLRDITQAIADSNTNVRAAEMFTHDSTAEGKFVVEVSNLTHLNRIIDKVKKVKGVISVKRSRTKEKSE